MSFDDPNLLSHAGLVPLAALAERAGLHDSAAASVRLAGEHAANAGLKIACLAAGMAAGADSTGGMGLLRHGAMEKAFGGVRAPSALGSFLRDFTWGNVSQLQKAHREVLRNLVREAPLLPGADVLAFIDLDSAQKRVYGYGKEGAAFGHTKIQGKSVLVKGLNVLGAVISTPLPAPVIAAARLRGGSAGSSRGAASLARQATGTARDCGCAGTIVVRMDSGFYSCSVIREIRAQGAHFPVTVAMNSSVRAAIAGIPEDARTPIRYPRAIWDDQAGCRVSDAGVAGIPYTAFTSKKKELHVTARLIVRRVRALNEKAAQGQGELFPAWRHHAVLTDSPFETLQSEDQHRDHAIVEQVFAGWNDGPPARLPSGRSAANAAWLVIAAITQNLPRAAGALAGPLHAKARAATIRRDLITVAARTARHGRGNLTLHLPECWHREHEWQNLRAAACGPPAAAA